MTLKNIVPKEATDHNLLTFDEYYKYKVKFDQSHEEVDNLDQNQFLNDTKSMISKKPKLGPVLKKLLKHIRNNGIFMNNPDRACSYISYILSKDVLKEIYDYQPETFKIFQDFVDKYNKRPGFTANICSNTLVYVISDIYQKMNKLYGLYELYKKIRTDYYYGNDKSCPSVSFLVRQYNDFIEEYPCTNIHYKKVLDEFKNEIQRSVDLYIEHACYRSKYNIGKIKLPVLLKEEQPKAPGPKEHQHNDAGYELPQAKSLSSLAEHQAPQEEPQLSREQPQISRALPQAPQEERHSSQEPLAHIAQHVVQQEEQVHQHGAIPRREYPTDLSQVYTSPYGPLLSSQTLSSPEHYPYPTVPLLSNKVEVSLSSFMNTITSTLKNVDPVPVVGVSGGMGALFLLFRYTPVGTFFRGRGYRQRIPTRFDGVYQGFLPGFQGFEEGYFPNDQINIAYGRE